MRISIVTPSFNQGRYLQEALESVRMQNHADVEHLVLDGASTDASVRILQSLDDHPAWPHVHWTSGPDGGQSEALNRGFAAATGDLVGWLNSDDRYRPGCFDRLLEAAETHPEVDVFYGDFTFMDEAGTIQRIRREIEFSRFILLYHRVLFIPTTSTFFRRRIFTDGHFLRNDLHYAMDYEYFLRLAVEGYRFRHIPHLMADFRLHAESKTMRMEQTQLDEKREIMRSFSPLSQRLPAPLGNAALTALQTAAGLRRWTEKLFNGAYLVQNRPSALHRKEG